MALRSNLKSQLDTITKKVAEAEKSAAKQIKSAIKSTEQFRSQQIKNVQGLMKHARDLRETGLAKQAEAVKKELESKATLGLDLVLSKLHVPSKKEIERLTKKVSQLQKRLEEIEKSSSSK